MSGSDRVPGRDDGLAGKVAVVTGGASGIGRALAVAYARAGTRTVVGYYPRDPHDVSETVAAVAAAGGECVPVAVDVARSAEVDALARTAVSEFGRLDIAVAGAGILRRAGLAELSDAAWEEMLAVDLTGVMRTFRSCAAQMRDGGAMVAISSIMGGVYGWEDHAHYTAAKAGVVGLCRALAVELAPRGIRVNALSPGLIESPQSLDPVNSLGPEGLAEAAKAIPAGRVGHVDEAARVIRFLTGDDSSYITGQHLVADGGLSIRYPG
jgi:3-oxoacyl-[acyl-carrier protein] reductase